VFGGRWKGGRGGKCVIAAPARLCRPSPPPDVRQVFIVFAAGAQARVATVCATMRPPTHQILADRTAYKAATVDFYSLFIASERVNSPIDGRCQHVPWRSCRPRPSVAPRQISYGALRSLIEYGLPLPFLLAWKQLNEK